MSLETSAELTLGSDEHGITNKPKEESERQTKVVEESQKKA